MRQVALALFLTFVFSGPALAEDLIKLEIAIRDHRFEPAKLRLPVGKPSLLTIRNADATPEEFESTALKIEKVVPGASTVTVRLRPLGPGRFPFIDEYHSDTAHGTVIASDGGHP